MTKSVRPDLARCSEREEETHMLLVWMYAPKRQTAGMSGTGEGYDAVAYGVVKLVPAVECNVPRQ